MAITKKLLTATTLMAGLLIAGPAFAGAAGDWQRPKGGGTAKVTLSGGKMSAVIVSGKKKGFTMFRGIAPAGKDTWKGDMKHPDMPGFMTFNGTVKYSGGKLHVQGCAIGGSMCDSEVWTQ